jgi:hypothetical protein
VVRHLQRLQVPLTFLVCIAVWSLGVGYLFGVVHERVQFDSKRAGIIKELNRQKDRVHRHLIELERP